MTFSLFEQFAIRTNLCPSDRAPNSVVRAAFYAGLADGIEVLYDSRQVNKIENELLEYRKTRESQ